jgi:hypothetical protein
LVRACLDWLKAHQILAWRNNSTGVRRADRNGRTFWSFTGLKGVSDILGCLAGGRLLAIEVKLPQGRVTEEQEWFLSTVQALGGLAGVVRTIPDLERLLSSLN